MFSLAPAAPDQPLDYRIVAAVSLLLSAWLIAIDPIITRDAIIYLRSADAYLQEGFFASQQLFGRPLLSVCMAVVHQLTGLPLLYAGLLVNSLCYALLCCAFVAVVRTMGGERRVQVFAAVVILSHPMLGEYRSSIMRDPAYWALMVLALRQLLLFARNPTTRHQLAWFGLILGATLFRFEGLFFAALAPFSMLFACEGGQRWRNCLRLLLPQLAVFATAATAVVLYQAVVNPGARLFPDIEKHLHALTAFSQRFGELSTQTGEVLLSFTSREDATVATVAGLGAILGLNLCRALTWPWTATLLWGWWRGLLRRISPIDATLINAHLAIALLYLGLFTLIRQFMLERYGGMFAIFALLYLPFLLNALWLGRPRKLLARFAVVTLLVVMCGDTLHNHNYRKTYIRDATHWIRDNTPAQATLITNHRYIAYFSRRQVDWGKGKPRNHKFDVARLAAEPALWQGHDLMAVTVGRRETRAWGAFLAQYALEELAVFESGNGDRVCVVQVPQKLYPKASRSSAKQSPIRASDTGS